MHNQFFGMPVILVLATIVGCSTSDKTTDESREQQNTEVQAQEAYDIVLDEVGERKDEIVDVIQTTTGKDKQETRDLVENVPSRVATGLSKDEAEKLGQDIENAGGSATTEVFFPVP